MGINSLHPFLRKNCPDIYETISLSEYAFKKVAIDTSLFLCKFKAICGDRWLSAFINLVSCLRRNELHCVFIYDSGCVQEKEEERAERRRQQEKNKQRVAELDEAYEKYELTGEITKILLDLYEKAKDSVKTKSFIKRTSDSVDMKVVKDKIEKMRGHILDISKDDFELTKELFNILKIPFYDAPLEAETMCADLCKRGLVDCVLTEDTDVLAYSCPIFLSKIDTTEDTCVRIHFKDILDNLEIKESQFLDLCIMCGCDYNKNIPKVGSQTAFKYLKKYGTIDEIEKNTHHDTSILNYKRTRDIFLNYPRSPIKTIPFCGSPDLKKLEKFVLKTNLNINFENLKKCFVHNVVVVIDDEEDPTEVEYEEVEVDTDVEYEEVEEDTKEEDTKEEDTKEEDTEVEYEEVEESDYELED